MRASNADVVAKEISKYIEEVEHHLKKMVINFSYTVTVKAIDTTPYGIMNPLYHIPERLKVYQPEVGHAKGGWNVGINSEGKDGEVAADTIDAIYTKNLAYAALQPYKIGDTVFITNSVPYVANKGWTRTPFGALEEGYSGQAPQGIKNPTIEEIKSVFQHDLKAMYDDLDY